MDSNEPIKILFLSADPTDASRLRLGQELRDIRERLQLAKQRDRFILESRESVRPIDISQAIFDLNPQIIHFSGHGTKTGELCFEDNSGKIQPIQPNALASLFELGSDQIRCVVLNACYSEIQAEAIAKYIPFVIGMSQEIEDETAISFVIGFYKALGANRSIELAYKYGCVEIQLQGMTGHLTPILHKKNKLIDDIFYVERHPIEEWCYRQISAPRCLIRIKAPHQMGKTLLIQKIFAYAAQQSYETVVLDFQLAERSVFSDIKTFLRWFCINITWGLQLPERLDDYWKDFGSPVQICTRYFEKYLLPQINTRLVLALDELACLYEHPEILQSFSAMLRSWHEMGHFSSVWRQLCLVISSNRDIGRISINESPFNVGLSIELREFNLKEVENLVQLYGLHLTNAQIKQLMNMIGGHPYLVRHALEKIKYQDITLKQLLKTAPTNTGIYSEHLRLLLLNLQQHPELVSAFGKVINATESTRLEPMLYPKLYGIGLIKYSERGVIPRCKLYLHYFRNHLDIRHIPPHNLLE